MRYILFLLCSPLFCLGQDEYRIGVKAGLNYSDVNAGSYDDFRPGFHIGGFGYGVISKHFQYGAEILYSNQGAKIILPGEEGTEAVTNLLTIGFIGRAFIIPDRLYFHGGGQIGFSLKEKVGDVKISPADKNNDIGLLAGLGMQFGKIDVSARYSHGLETIEHRVFQLSIGYSLF